MSEKAHSADSYRKFYQETTKSNDLRLKLAFHILKAIPTKICTSSLKLCFLTLAVKKDTLWEWTIHLLIVVNFLSILLDKWEENIRLKELYPHTKTLMSMTILVGIYFTVVVVALWRKPVTQWCRNCWTPPSSSLCLATRPRGRPDPRAPCPSVFCAAQSWPTRLGASRRRARRWELVEGRVWPPQEWGGGGRLSRCCGTRQSRSCCRLRRRDTSPRTPECYPPPPCVTTNISIQRH